MAEKKKRQRSAAETSSTRSRYAQLAAELANELSIDMHPDTKAQAPAPDLPTDANIGTSSQEERTRAEQANAPEVSPTSNDDVYSALAQSATEPTQEATSSQNLPENIPVLESTSNAPDAFATPLEFAAAQPHEEAALQDDGAWVEAERKAMAVLDHDLYGTDMEAAMEEDISGANNANTSRNPQLTSNDVQQQTAQSTPGISFVAQQESVPVAEDAQANSGAQTFAQVNEFEPVEQAAAQQHAAVPQVQTALPPDMSSVQAEPAPHQAAPPEQVNLNVATDLDYDNQADLGPRYDAGYSMEAAMEPTPASLPGAGFMPSASNGPAPPSPNWADFHIQAGRRPVQDEAAAFFKLSGGPFTSLLRQPNLGAQQGTESSATEPGYVSGVSHTLSPNDAGADSDLPQESNQQHAPSDTIEEEGDMAVPVEEAPQ